MAGVIGMRHHGMSRWPEHAVWRAMKKRCLNLKSPKWVNYGGRGIKVCERWRMCFSAFITDMGRCPPGLTLERCDNDKDYEPGNCVWATRKAQANNRRAPKISTRNKSGLKGVCWVDPLAVFEVSITAKGKTYKLGRTPDFLEACCRRKSAEHRLNFKPAT